MGIPEFYGGYIAKYHQNVVHRQLPTGVDVHSLAIDTPGIIHQAAQKTWFYGGGTDKISPRELNANVERLIKDGPDEAFNIFASIVENKIAEIVSAYQPKVLILAIDGKAPLAKVQQQRKRRYGARMNYTPEELGRFDSAKISPGTEFMDKLDKRLQSWINRAQTPYKTNYRDNKGDIKDSFEAVLPQNVIYSPHTVPGEAEHKIMDIWFSEKINQFPIRKDRKSRVVNVLYGKDADLILLSLGMPQNKVDNIYVVRESYTNVVDISGLRQSLGMIGIGSQDYITIMSFIGNDFVPRQPSMKNVECAIDQIIGSYAETKKIVNNSLQAHGLNSTDVILTDNEGIIWENMAILINLLAKKEISLFGKVARINANTSELDAQKKRWRNGSRNIKDKPEKDKGEKYFENKSDLLDKASEISGDKVIIYYDKYRKLWYDNAMGIHGSENDIKFLKSILSDIDLVYEEEDITHMVMEYLSMFSWVQRYYFYGDVKWDKYYPYHYAPLLNDLNKVLQKLTIDAESIDKLNAQLNDVVSDPPDKGKYNVLHQLLAILPPESSDLVPMNIRRFMNPYSYISDLYPTKIRVDKDGTFSSMMYNYILPLADMNRIMDAVDNTFLTMPMDNWLDLSGEYIFSGPRSVRLPKNPRIYHLARASSHKEKQPAESESSYGGSSSSGSQGFPRGGRGSRGIRGAREERGRGRGRGRGRSLPSSQTPGYFPTSPHQPSPVSFSVSSTAPLPVETLPITDELVNEYRQWRLTDRIIEIMDEYDAPDRHEKRAALERYLMASANAPPTNYYPQWATIYREPRGKDIDKFRQELLDQDRKKQYQNEINDMVHQIIQEIGMTVVNQGDSVPQELLEEMRQNPPVCTNKFARFGEYSETDKEQALGRMINVGGPEATLKVLLRYAALGAYSSSWGIPFNAARRLHKNYEVEIEGFASPLNSRLMGLDGVFCSLFPDVDKPFGSIGSFFKVGQTAKGGAWMINPPYIEDILLQAAEIVLERAAKEKDYEAYFMAPVWNDCKAYKMLESSSYLVAFQKSEKSDFRSEDSLGKQMTGAATAFFGITGSTDVLTKTKMKNAIAAIFGEGLPPGKVSRESRAGQGDRSPRGGQSGKGRSSIGSPIAPAPPTLSSHSTLPPPITSTFTGDQWYNMPLNVRHFAYISWATSLGLIENDWNLLKPDSLIDSMVGHDLRDYPQIRDAIAAFNGLGNEEKKKAQDEWSTKWFEVVPPGLKHLDRQTDIS